MADEGKIAAKLVCVTGAGGYIGSWLVKNLLQRNYRVNATLRDPGDESKSRPLLDLPGAQDRLKLFKADLLEDGSFESAVEGCEGVFHLAGPMGVKENTLEDFVVPAVNGVVNVMKACTKAKSVRRVVFTSSVAAALARNDNGDVTHSFIDESCWSPLSFLKTVTSRMSCYMTAKTLAEQEALKYGTDNNLEVVTVLPGVVVGPWFTVTPALTSSQTILALIGGNDRYHEALKFMEFTLGSIPIVHIEDVCNAQIFLMEHPTAGGRHVCSADSMSLKCLKYFLAKQLKASLKLHEVDWGDRYLSISSKKLLDMGFVYKYSLKQAFEEGIECAMKNRIIKMKGKTYIVRQDRVT